MAFPVIIDQAGPLPISTTVQWPSSNTVVIAVSGSAYAKTPGTMLNVKVNMAGTWIGTIQMFANQATTHLAFPTGFTAVKGGYGQFTLTLSAADGNTLTDANDHFTVALLY
ncbi:MAG TPA: hypothetical protein VGC13_06465 [Longimicrobium sp.]|jgi:hypothetical protein|uniref:hypothetical protein n=1 Tax=Longimicrobium sp. TaxID=2029185 RepID=UPI002ED9E77E